MNIEEIQVTLLPDGTVQLNIQGVQGSACLEITRELEQALGGPIISRVMTQEGLEAFEITAPVQAPKQVRRRQPRKS
jgi:hypothetical protein